MSFDGSGFVDLGPIREQIPINNGIMPVAYGYLKDVINKKEKDNIDVLVFSNRDFSTGDEIEVIPFAVIKRSDEDHKVLTRDDTVLLKGWSNVSLKERKLILDYFGFKGRVKVEGVDEAESYINQSLIGY
jgi:inorganic pyrophosphatase